MAATLKYGFLFLIATFWLKTCVNAGDLTVEEMWKHIEEGDKERQKAHLIIDGEEVNTNGKREIREYDILDDDKPEKRQTTSLEAQIDWHRKIWRERVIPYDISYVFNSEELQTIIESMGSISDKTCLTFRRKVSSDQQWLKFFKGQGCYSGIGRKYWKYASTEIALGNGCVYKPIIIHEMLHALGFPHEQGRYDRDSYVTIHRNRIIPSMESNFDKAVYDQYNHVGTPYDIKSIMQYSRNSFTLDYKLGPTMEYKFDGNIDLGSTVLSEIDIAELNGVYQCSVSSGWSNWSGWSYCFQKRWGSRECSKANVRFCLSSSCSGQNEYGVQEQVELCAANQCTDPPVDGQWGAWGDYTSCSESCGWGIQTRYRECNNPKESYGGKTCIGRFSERYACRNPRCPGYSSVSDALFDKGFGKWTYSGFVARDGAGPNNNVGPKSGVSGKGRYAVLSNSVSTLLTGNLKSPTISEHKDGKKCLTFYYQLNGLSFPKRSLDVYTKDSSDSYMNFVSMTGPQGNYWKRKSITINAMSNSYQIIFEAKVSGVNNEVAIDDIFIDSGECAQGLEGECKDLKTDCETDAKGGRCNIETNKRLMQRNCCNTCSVCKNHNNKCEQWATDGQCVRSIWMLWNCCKACYQKCQDTSVTSVCKDNVKYASKCPQWAAMKECTKNVGFMAINCYKSCYAVLSQ